MLCRLQPRWLTVWPPTLTDRNFTVHQENSHRLLRASCFAQPITLLATARARAAPAIGLEAGFHRFVGYHRKRCRIARREVAQDGGFRPGHAGIRGRNS
jgi:hypothetical protein